MNLTDILLTLLPLLTVGHLEKKDWGMLNIGDEANYRKIRFIFCYLILTSAEKHMNLFLKVSLSNVIVPSNSLLATQLSLKPNKWNK